MTDFIDKLRSWPLSFMKKNPKTALWTLIFTLPLCIILLIAILIPGGRVKYREYFDIDTRNIEIVDTIKLVEYDTIDRITYDTVKKEIIRNIVKTIPVNKSNSDNLVISKNGANSNFGTNSGIIGNNGTINNLGEQPVTLSNSEIQTLRDSIYHFRTNKLNPNKPITVNIMEAGGNSRSHDKALLISEFIFGKQSPYYGKFSTHLMAPAIYKKFIFKVNPSNNEITIIVGNY